MASIQAGTIPQWHPTTTRVPSQGESFMAALVVAALLAALCAAWFATGAVSEDPEQLAATILQTD